MILQALVAEYEALVEQGKLERPGWSGAKISYALYINDDGELTQVADVRLPDERGKLRPQTLSLPSPEKRTVGIAPNFLWDNTGYLLGADDKGKPERSQKCFLACQALHHQLLDGVDSPAARALLAFFDRWQPATAPEHPALQERWAEMAVGANLVFRYGDAFVQDDPLVRQAWQQHYSADGDGPQMTCLVTGQKGPALAVHPAIKGLVGAQSSGAALVSFNAPAFCSYGREQNLNAPTGQYAAFAYTAALNYLLADRKHTSRLGDTTVLFWAKDGKTAYQSLFSACVWGESSGYSTGDLADLTAKLIEGQFVLFEKEKLDPQMEFFILGLSPNAARLSVRFFLHNTFGALLQNVQNHYRRLEIVRPINDKFETIPPWKLLDETINQKSKDKSPAPSLAGEILRAILTDTRYPADLLNGVTLRIRAEREVTRGRAAILKAYYLKNPHPDIPKPEEVLTVSLNPDSTNVAYNLGRLFSVLEAIQSDANPGINTTIKDKFFNAASATPSRVFPTLVNLTQKHLRKLKEGQRIFYDKQLTDLHAKLEDTYPDRMSLTQQGSFQLGYYHQKQARYQKKEENENV